MSKKSIEKRLEVIEKIQSSGIDWLAKEVQGLFQNDNVIGEAVEDHDTTIAALKALLAEKGIITEDEVQAKRKQIDKMRADAQKARAKEAEMRQVAENAKKASLEDQGHPPEAFLFGG
jgi:predicted nucleotidyltransferase